MASSSFPAPSTIIFALHILLLHPHIFLAIKYRTYRFMFLLGTGAVLEVVGQIFHTLHRPEPFTSCATIFFCAAVHSLWVDLLGICNQKWEAYERFPAAEVIATSVVGSGAVAAWKGHVEIGEAIVKAGMGWFSGSIVVLWGALWCCSLREEAESARLLKGIGGFRGGLSSATLCVLTRVYIRLTNQNGWFVRGTAESDSGLTLDGGIMLLAVLILTIIHPGQLSHVKPWRARREERENQTERGVEKQRDKAVAE